MVNYLNSQDISSVLTSLEARCIELEEAIYDCKDANKLERLLISIEEAFRARDTFRYMKL